MEKKLLKILGFVALYSVIASVFLGFYGYYDLYSAQTKLSVGFFEQERIPSEVSTLTKREYFFNYSKKELEILNKYNTDKKCSFNSKDLILSSNFQFLVDCQSNKLPTFLYGDQKTCFTMHSDSKMNVMWDSLQHKNKSSEFVFIKCSKDRIYPFVTNQYNKDHETSAREIRDKISMNSKNLNILVLSLESLSRNAAFRHLPKFLSLFQGSEYKFFNFTQYSIVSSKFKENYFKAVYGNNYKSFFGDDADIFKKNEFVNRNKDNKELCAKWLEKIAIWNIYKKLGFVTMYLNDKLNLFHSDDDDYEYSANHVFVNFWKANLALNEYLNADSIQKNKQKCSGNRTHYEISFDYTTQFFKNYKNSNKFSFVHISHSKTSKFNYEYFDSSLYSFIKNLLAGKHPNLAIFFFSHQSEQFSEFTVDLRGFYESINPFFFLIADKKLINDLGSEDTLKYNTDRLLTGGDVYKTLKNLANYPFDDLHDMKILPYMKNFFIEKIDANRNCKDAGVKAESCLNNGFFLLSLKNKNEAKILDELVLLMKKLSHTFSLNNKNCKELGQVRINFAEKFYLIYKDQERSSLYKINAYDDWHKNFTILGFFTTNKKSDLISSTTTFKILKNARIGIQAVEGLESCIKPN